MEKEVVIARYNESIKWAIRVPYPVTVYNHGDPIDLDHPNIDVIDLKNVGKEAHCWLEHLCRNYDDLAPMTWFVQAKPHLSIDRLIKRMELPITETTPLVLEYLSYFPDREVKDRDRVEHLEDEEIRWGDARFHGNRQPHENEGWLTSIWQNLFDGPQPDPWWFGYCASYGVPSKRITDRPLEFWMWLRDVVENQENPVEQTPFSPWALEVAWGYLWGDAEKYPVRAIPKPEKEFPGFFEMVGNFAKSATAQILAGNPMASKELQEQRKAICQGCEFLRDNRCTQCGCHLTTKVSWETSKCPINKW